MPRTARLGLGLALSLGALAAAPAGGPVPISQAEAGCTPLAEIYGSSRGWYATAGARCDKKMHKIAISGNLWGSDHFFEFSKECFRKRFCFEDTPVYRGDQPGDVIKIAIAAGWKSGRFSIPKYVGRKRSFRLKAPSDRPN